MNARGLMVAMVVAGVAVAGCSSSSKSSGSGTTPSTAAVPKTNPKVTITARDYSFTLPAQLPAGYVDITLDNKGTQDHQVQLIKVGSMTVAQLKAAAVKTDIGAAKVGTVFAGGPNDAAPGKSTTATVKLDPGLYAVTCFIPIPGSKTVPHASKGMFATVKVVATDATVNTAPVSSSTITLGDFTFVVPPGFTGKGTVDISNQGDEVHELNLFRMAPGVTLASAKAALLASGPPPAGPPPITEITGTTGLSPGQHAWLRMNLAPGHYLLVCFFPDPHKANLPHFLEGMISEITVGSPQQATP